ncbi:hypothetical protein [Hirschia baltica]|nr:hypothetical protein [Hirschia baltica]
MTLTIIAFLMTTHYTSAIANPESNDLKPVTVHDPSAQPTTPPNVEPLIEVLMQTRKSASCIVTLSVDIQGIPFDLTAKCDFAEYEPAAIEAMQSARFAPKFIYKTPVIRVGVEYPIELKM